VTDSEDRVVYSVSPPTPTRGHTNSMVQNHAVVDAAIGVMPGSASRVNRQTFKAYCAILLRPDTSPGAASDTSHAHRRTLLGNQLRAMTHFPKPGSEQFDEASDGECRAE